MNSKKMILSACVVLLAGTALAQQADASDAQKYARHRAEAYAAALGLDDAVTTELTKVYMTAEGEVAPLRAQCAAIKAKVEGTLVPYDKKAEELLTKEQREKLAEMRAAGTWTPGDMCCSSAEAEKAGCAGHGKAAAGAAGCCAGKAGAGHAHGEAAPEKRTPAPSTLPDSR
ncbi:MAG: hypothetical protein IPL52_01265 [Flavobacteriales bacterium]|nr:hypothetical protein [Flavobacteriales bacterium]